MLKTGVPVSTDLREPQNSANAWPPEVDLILSALEAGGAHEERRRVKRTRYQVQAQLRLFSDPPGTDPWILYTRDINPKGLGFITQHRLPLGYGGKLQIPSTNGQIVTIHCTLYRCRESAQGWFEGALYFNREQWIFSLQ
jgi:hypothetical protein